MAALVFIATIFCLLAFIIMAGLRLIKRKPLTPVFKKTGYLTGVYVIIWIVFKFLQTQIPVPFGADVCFDDWCATITNVELNGEIQKELAVVAKDSICLVLHVRMSNHARGIAQKPSEPRIHIQDDHHRSWSYSPRGQQLFENMYGKQPGIDSRLELHESKVTALVFIVPVNGSGLKAIIEEGPFITSLFFPEDQSVFLINKSN